MHLLLTDRLTCPRCGPAFGLILLAHEMRERRVIEGVLGCPNCRDAFPVTGGFGDLRAPPRRQEPRGLAGPPADPDPERFERMVALLGIVRGPGTVALVGGSAALGPSLAAQVPDLDVMAVDPDMHDWPDSERFHRLMADPGIPVMDRTLRGVGVDARVGDGWLVEAARVAGPQSRVVVENASDDVPDALRAAGLSVLAAEAGTVVAARG